MQVEDIVSVLHLVSETYNGCFLLGIGCFLLGMGCFQLGLGCFQLGILIAHILILIVHILERIADFFRYHLFKCFFRKTLMAFLLCMLKNTAHCGGAVPVGWLVVRKRSTVRLVIKANMRLRDSPPVSHKV